MRALTFLTIILLFTRIASSQVPESYRWVERDIDTINIGYGLQLADVNGDDRTDIVLADQRTIQWYGYPNWEKHIIAKDLTERDNVCVAARDIDGDGKCEIAVGAQWNFKETLKDGAVFYLHAPEDRTRLWEPIRLYNDPSTHRMLWIKGPDNQYTLLVKPLRGRGSINGLGPGIRLMEYTRPENPRDTNWKIDLVSDFLNLSHNFHLINWDNDPEEEVLIAAQQGVWLMDRVEGKWKSTQLTKDFAGEIRDGKLPGGRRFIATVEPMHGNKSAVYVEPQNGETLWPQLVVLDNELLDAHALVVADFLGIGSDQVVVGWRAMDPKGIPGIAMFTPLDPDGKNWRKERISAENIAVEDLKAGDMNGDGRVDIVAAGRQTKNLKIFFSQ